VNSVVANVAVAADVVQEAEAVLVADAVDAAATKIFRS
jgi:hypothetical protein